MIDDLDGPWLSFASFSAVKTASSISSAEIGMILWEDILAGQKDKRVRVKNDQPHRGAGTSHRAGAWGLKVCEGVNSQLWVQRQRLLYSQHSIQCFSHGCDGAVCCLAKIW